MKYQCDIEPRLVLRPACMSDCFQALHWRNKPEVRKYSGTTEEINPVSHREWWRQAIMDKRRFLYMMQYQRSDVGVVRLDIRGDMALVSIYVDPSLWGHGYAKEALHLIHAKARCMDIRLLRAEIHEDNGDSIKLFSGCGYRQVALE